MIRILDFIVGALGSHWVFWWEMMRSDPCFRAISQALCGEQMGDGVVWGDLSAIASLVQTFLFNLFKKHALHAYSMPLPMRSFSISEKATTFHPVVLTRSWEYPWLYLVPHPPASICLQVLLFHFFPPSPRPPPPPLGGLLLSPFSGTATAPGGPPLHSGSPSPTHLHTRVNHKPFSHLPLSHDPKDPQRAVIPSWPDPVSASRTLSSASLLPSWPTPCPPPLLRRCWTSAFLPPSPCPCCSLCLEHCSHSPESGQLIILQTQAECHSSIPSLSWHIFIDL